MAWKDILKNSSIEKVQRVLDFVKNEMRPKFGPGENFLDKGKLTEQVASNILDLFENGKSTPSSQIRDRRGNTSIDLYIDDGFDLRIGDEFFHFIYFNQGDLFENLQEGRISPEEIEKTISDFLRLIGREDLEHGLTAELMRIPLGE